MDYEALEKSTLKKTEQRARKKRKRMNISGKSVFTLGKLMQKTTGKRIAKIKRRKK